MSLEKQEVGVAYEGCYSRMFFLVCFGSVIFEISFCGGFLGQPQKTKKHHRTTFPKRTKPSEARGRARPPPAGRPKAAAADGALAELGRSTDLGRGATSGVEKGERGGGGWYPCIYFILLVFLVVVLFLEDEVIVKVFWAKNEGVHLVLEVFEVFCFLLKGCLRTPRCSLVSIVGSRPGKNYIRPIL